MNFFYSYFFFFFERIQCCAILIVGFIAQAISGFDHTLEPIAMIG